MRKSLVSIHELKSRLSQDDFREIAEQRYTEIVSSGMTMAWSDIRQHLEQRIAGKKTTRPKARKFMR